MSSYFPNGLFFDTIRKRPFLISIISKNMEQNKTIEKAGAIIFSNIDKNNIALLYRGKQQDWSFPKGHAEEGEESVQTMIREIKEETGLDVKILQSLPSLDYTHPNGNTISTKMFLVQSEDDSKVKLENPDDDIKWIAINEVSQTLSYDNLKEYFEKIYPILEKLTISE
ncbi:MAG: NUDIX domain-containing protein [Parcubacteria group bacterium]|nr:NUDIX domain-containing protein [Parcubacteria group bacterium]